MEARVGDEKETKRLNDLKADEERVADYDKRVQEHNEKLAELEAAQKKKEEEKKVKEDAAEAIIRAKFDRPQPSSSTVADDTESLLKLATEAKERGNKRVRQGEHLAAYANYEEALDFLQKISPSEQKAAEALMLSIFSNLALCALKINCPDKAFKYSQLVLAVEPDNAKAFYRCASALIALNRRLDAVTFMEQAVSRTPGDASLAAELDKLKTSLLAAQ
jgi:Tfp pilus assembly protein PilF